MKYRRNLSHFFCFLKNVILRNSPGPILKETYFKGELFQRRTIQVRMRACSVTVPAELFLWSLPTHMNSQPCMPGETIFAGPHCLSRSSRSLPKSLPEASQDVQNRFPKGLSMPSKRKCVLSGLWDEFGTRLGHPLGGHLGRKNGLEAIQNRFLFTTKLKHRFRRVWNGFWNGLWHDFIWSAAVIEHTKTMTPPH